MSQEYADIFCYYDEFNCLVREAVPENGIKHTTEVGVLCEIHPKLIPVVLALMSRKDCIPRKQKKKVSSG